MLPFLISEHSKNDQGKVRGADDNIKNRVSDHPGTQHKTLRRLAEDSHGTADGGSYGGRSSYPALRRKPGRAARSRTIGGHNGFKSCEDGGAGAQLADSDDNGYKENNEKQADSGDEKEVADCQAAGYYVIPLAQAAYNAKVRTQHSCTETLLKHHSYICH